jgi:hypothetical protein
MTLIKKIKTLRDFLIVVTIVLAGAFVIKVTFKPIWIPWTLAIPCLICAPIYAMLAYASTLLKKIAEKNPS